MITKEPAASGEPVVGKVDFSYVPPVPFTPPGPSRTQLPTTPNPNPNPNPPAPAPAPGQAPVKDPRYSFLARRDIGAVQDRLYKTIVPEIERVEIARGEARLVLEAAEEALKAAEDNLVLLVQEQGKNAEERKARLSVVKAENPEYTEARKVVREADRQQIIKNANYNRLLHEFSALKAIAEVYASQNRVMAPGGG